MFYYLAHVAVLHVGVALVTFVNGLPVGWWWTVTGGTPVAGYEPVAWHALVAWIVTVAILLPPCRWWAGVKRRSDSWLVALL